MATETASATLTVGDAEIAFVGLTDAAAGVVNGAYRGAVHLCNAYTLSLAEERPDIADAVKHGTACFPDGMPLVWWAKRHGVPNAERVYGPDLMEAVLDTGQGTGIGHYLYGSTPEVLANLEAQIADRWPDARVAGSESPPFRPLTDDDLAASIERIRSTGASVVWVGMGTPKQDLLVQRFASVDADRTYVAIGAAFDFIAGTKKQAPRWVMRIGMEWLYRLVTEPRRLWKRYLVYNVKFARLLWRQRRASNASG